MDKGMSVPHGGHEMRKASSRQVSTVVVLMIVVLAATTLSGCRSADLPVSVGPHTVNVQIMDFPGSCLDSPDSQPIPQIRGDTAGGLTLLPFLLENGFPFVINSARSSASFPWINVV